MPLTEYVKPAAKLAFAAGDLFTGRWPGPRILIYHQVNAAPKREMEVSIEAFAAQLEWLNTNAEVASLADALARRSEVDAHRLVVLTFDDGYADFYFNGYPLLAERGWPFTLYLSSHPIETRRPLAEGIGADPLTWDQVNEMRGSGLVTLGGHTHTHADLRHATLDEVSAELERNDEMLASRTGETPLHFAYPWGYWSAVADPVVRARYRSATLGSGEPVTANSDPFLLNRIPVQRSDGVALFRRRMWGGLRLEDKLRRRIRGYQGP